MVHFVYVQRGKIYVYSSRKGQFNYVCERIEPSDTTRKSIFFSPFKFKKNPVVSAQQHSQHLVHKNHYVCVTLTCGDILIKEVQYLVV